jgi:succinoglycan biosynthesis protein ExoA
MTMPSISLILPVRNEEKYIGASLDNIFKQIGIVGEFEVIVVDGMSTDKTKEIIRAYQIEHHNLSLINNPSKIVPTGMNIAILRAKGNIIIRVDGHCEIAPDYVSKCVKHILEDNVEGVGGPMNTIGNTFLSKTIACAMSSTFGVGGSAFRTVSGKTLYADTVPFPAYTRAIIEKVGLYDEELIRNQDDEYNYRIRENGGRLLLSADVNSTYYSRGSLTKLWKQYFQYGYWKVRVLQKHPHQMSLRQFIPPVFVLALILSFLLLVFLPWGWVALAMVVGGYLLANFEASFIAASRKGWRYLTFLPITFAILHLSYGAGFLIGICKFWNRWGDKKGKVPDFRQIQT